MTNLALDTSRQHSRPITNTRVASWLRRLAYFAFAGTVVLLPLRLRLVLVPRPSPPIYADYTDFLLFAADGLLLLTLGLWGLSLAMDSRSISAGPALLWAPIAGFTAVGGLSSAFSVDPALSLYHTVRLAALFALYLYVVNEIRSLKLLVWPVALQAGLQSVIAIGQLYAQRSLGLQLLGEHLLDPAWSGVSVVGAQGTRILRAYGLSDHPNLLGGTLTFALLLLIASYATGGRRSRWLLLAIAVSFAGLLATFSRAAWLGLAVGLLFLWLMLRRHEPGSERRLLFVFVIVEALVILFLLRYPGAVASRLGLADAFAVNPLESRSLSERGTLNAATNEVFAENALTGTGLGALPLALRARFPEFPFFYQPAHLTLLEAAAEIGLLGAGFYALALAAPWLALALRRERPAGQAWIAASAVLLAITVVGLFDYYPWLLNPGRLWQWLAWGWWAASFTAAGNGDA